MIKEAKFFQGFYKVCKDKDLDPLDSYRKLASYVNHQPDFHQAFLKHSADLYQSFYNTGIIQQILKQAGEDKSPDNIFKCAMEIFHPGCRIKLNSGIDVNKLVDIYITKEHIVKTAGIKSDFSGDFLNSYINSRLSQSYIKKADIFSNAWDATNKVLKGKDLKVPVEKDQFSTEKQIKNRQAVDEEYMKNIETNTPSTTIEVVSPEPIPEDNDPKGILEQLLGFDLRGPKPAVKTDQEQQVLKERSEAAARGEAERLKAPEDKKVIESPKKPKAEIKSLLEEWGVSPEMQETLKYVAPIAIALILGGLANSMGMGGLGTIGGLALGGYAGHIIANYLNDPNQEFSLMPGGNKEVNPEIAALDDKIKQQTEAELKANPELAEISIVMPKEQFDINTIPIDKVAAEGFFDIRDKIVAGKLRSALTELKKTKTITKEGIKELYDNLQSKDNVESMYRVMQNAGVPANKIDAFKNTIIKAYHQGTPSINFQ
jgi:hypothetical protein